MYFYRVVLCSMISYLQAMDYHEEWIKIEHTRMDAIAHELKMIKDSPGLEERSVDNAFKMGILLRTAFLHNKYAYIIGRTKAFIPYSPESLTMLGKELFPPVQALEILIKEGARLKPHDHGMQELLEHDTELKEFYVSHIAYLTN